MTIFRVVNDCTLPIDEAEKDLLPDISSSRGFVYVLERPEDDEKSEMLCKVGYTSVSASSRAREYTDGGWEVHYEVEMQDWLARLVERDLHRALERYWFDPAILGGIAKEVFMCPRKKLSFGCMK